MIYKYFHKITTQSQVKSTSTWLCIFILAHPGWYAKAQVVHPASPLEDYIRLIYLDSTETDLLERHIFYPSTLSLEGTHFSTLSSSSGGFKLINPEGRLHYNSAFPYGYNDGPVWKGRGITTELLTGFQFSAGKFHVTFSPNVSYIQNLSFDLAPVIRPNKSQYNYQFPVGGDIDWVQRYGDKPFIYFYPGQSEVRYLGDDITIAISTQNKQIGPATYNPILLSQQGPGLPHIELASSRYIEVNIKGINFGSLKPQLLYGVMKESKYFDTNTDNNLRYFTSLTVTWQVPGLEGLKFGGSRVLYEDMQFFETKDLARTFAYFAKREFVVTSSGRTLNDYFDQMASLFFEWTFKESDARFYLEFTKNDFHTSLRDLFVDLDHARAYTFGIEKKVILPESKLLISFEHTNLRRSISYNYRPTPPYYSHSQVRNGYSIDGQLLGAGIGPGSSSNTLSFIDFRDKGFFKIKFQRVQQNDDFLLTSRTLTNTNRRRVRAVEWLYTIEGYRQLKDISIGLELTLNNNISRYYIDRNDPVNLYTGINLQYRLK